MRLKAAEDKNVSLADQLRIRDRDAAEDTKKIITEKEKLVNFVSFLSLRFLVFFSSLSLFLSFPFISFFFSFR